MEMPIRPGQHGALRRRREPRNERCDHRTQFSNTPRWDMGDLEQQTFFVLDKLQVGDVSDPQLIVMPDGSKAYRIVQLLVRSEPHRCEPEGRLPHGAAGRRRQETGRRRGPMGGGTNDRHPCAHRTGHAGIAPSATIGCNNAMREPRVEEGNGSTRQTMSNAQ